MLKPIEVATVTCFYNSVSGLARLLPTMVGHFKAHVFLDGVYKNFPTKSCNGLSTDGSSDFIEGYFESAGLKPTILKAPFKTEYEKRSMYLDAELLIRDLGVNAILILDTDEYIDVKNTDWDVFYADLNHKINEVHRGAWNVYGIMVSEKVKGREWDSFQAYPSLWYKPWDMIYKPQSHYKFINCRWELKRHFNNDYSQYPIANIEGIKVYHDHEAQSEEYKKGVVEYQNWLRGHEARLAQEIQRKSV